MQEEEQNRQETGKFWQVIRPSRLVERYYSISPDTKVRVGATTGILGLAAGLTIADWVSGNHTLRDAITWASFDAGQLWLATYMINPFKWQFIRNWGGDVLYQIRSNNYRCNYRCRQ